jgi:hypothetical protein
MTKRFFIEETTVYEVTADSLEEVKNTWDVFFADGYDKDMPLKLKHCETKLTDETGEEVEYQDFWV